MYERNVGVDLLQNCFTYCISYADGKEPQIGTHSIRELNKFASILGSNTALAVEATGNTFKFCQELKEKVGRLVLC